MRRTVLLLGVLSIGYAHAQREGRIGINTAEPDATLHIVGKRINNQDKRAQGVIFPKLSTTERDQYTVGLKEGTLIYNTTLKCVDLYDGTKWSCITTVATGGGGNSGGGTPVGGGSGSGTQGAITGNVVLAGKTHYIASVKDKEYIPFVKPTQPATWETGETIGNDPLIDVQGTITTQGITIQIPITGSGTVGAYRQEVAVTAEKSKNNQAGTLILEWGTQQVTSSNSYITAKLKAKNTDFHIKQLDLAKGLGNDYKGLVLANFTYKKDNTNSATETFTVRAISGIPDKKFGQVTPGTNKLERQFIYLPIQGPDGKLWLNNNLGAEYANINSPYFNPAHQAGALDYSNTTANPPALTNPTADQIKKDWRAYGYLYEFGRDADGHEIIYWTSSTDGRLGYKRIAQSEPPTNTYQKVKDPCPLGFHTPDHPELKNLAEAIMGEAFSYNQAQRIEYSDSGLLWAERELRFPAAGYRTPSRGYSQIGFKVQGVYGEYRTSSIVSTTYSSTFQFGNNSVAIGRNSVSAFGDGRSIRCIAD